ncbi:MAG: hypothetical protein AAFN70_08370 [Planctomycetota bacterium]
MRAFFAGFIVGAIVLFTLMSYHIVYSENGLVLVPKIDKGFSDPYVDVRGFTIEDWREHRGLAVAVARSQETQPASQFRHEPADVPALNQVGDRVASYFGE